MEKYSSKDLKIREHENSEHLEQLFGNGNQIEKDITSLKRKNRVKDAKNKKKNALDAFIENNRHSVDDKIDLKSRKSMNGISDTYSLLSAKER